MLCLVIQNNTVLNLVNLPLLPSVMEHIAVDWNPALTTFALPELTTVWALQIEWNALLTVLSFPKLNMVEGDIHVLNNDELPTCLVMDMLSQMEGCEYSGEDLICDQVFVSVQGNNDDCICSEENDEMVVSCP